MATRQEKEQGDAQADAIETAMTALLAVHTAPTRAALADAIAGAAEQIVGAPYAFMYFEREDGTLAYQAPASETRKRSHRRAIEAAGEALFGATIDPRDVAALAESLDTGTTVSTQARDLFTPLVDAGRGAALETALGVERGCAAAVNGAGDRYGAFVVLGSDTIAESHIGLLAAHAGCACMHLASAESAADAARDAATEGLVRTIFDARKIESELQRELARSQRYGRDVSICLIETTNIGLLRERFGAALTQQLYERLGDELARHARDIDIIGAYRESGYTMVLAEAAPAGVEAAAHRLAAAAAAVELEGKPVPGLELHVAVGYATAPSDGASAEQLFAAAQRRMYGDAARRVA
jgi:diguanylate cyclase (GGDEF)-like protein